MAVTSNILLPDVVFEDSWDGCVFNFGGAGLSGKVLARVVVELASKTDGRRLVIDSAVTADNSRITLNSVSAGAWVVTLPVQDIGMDEGPVEIAVTTFTTTGWKKTFVQGEFKVLPRS